MTSHCIKYLQSKSIHLAVLLSAREKEKKKKKTQGDVANAICFHFIAYIKPTHCVDSLILYSSDASTTFSDNYP